jgi:hypothetical protein
MPKKRTRPRSHVVRTPDGYRDIYDVRDARKGPLVLLDGTSIEWPKGWTAADAARWRRASRLEKPL